MEAQSATKPTVAGNRPGDRAAADRAPPAQVAGSIRSPIHPGFERLAGFHAMLNAGPRSVQLKAMAKRLNPASAPPRANATGLPDGLKAGVEALSGIPMDGVRVHYRSAEPAQLNAHAFARGADIHVAPGQERHLPHEAWHVVQQAQGRVKPTTTLAKGIPASKDQALEREADSLGARAAAFAGEAGQDPRLDELPARGAAPASRPLPSGGAVVQQFAFTLGRGLQADPHRESKEAAIATQNRLLRAVHTLYVAGSNNPEATAAASPSMAQPDAITVGRDALYPRDDHFADNVVATFSGEYFNYKVQLISHPDMVPDWNAPAAIDAVVAQRVAAPYRIVSMSVRGGGGAGMGRPVGGPQWWGINSEFNGVVGHRVLWGHELVAWGIGELLLPMDRYLKGSPGPGLRKMPATSFDPFIFYLEGAASSVQEPIGTRAVIDIGDFERRFERVREEGGAYAEQEGLSKAPSVARKEGGSDRDPGTMMGTSAWKAAGGKPAPLPGALASHEWCHLLGDGDSGPCAPANLVIGTNSVNTEQLAMENALRPYRPGLMDHFGLAIQIQARALCSRVMHDGTEYLQADHIEYNIDLVNPARPAIRFEIFRRVMDGRRGAISELEFITVGNMAAEQLNLAIVRFLREGVPKELGPGPSSSQGGGSSSSPKM